MNDQLNPIPRAYAPAPLVSIVVPARNAARTLAQTLASARAQDFSNWELLVVDDGSTDNTHLIANRFATHDARISCIRGPGRGVSAARNLALRAARGSLVAFLDADDLWLPGKLSAHVALMAARPEVGVSFDRILFVDTRGRSTGVESTKRVQGLKASEFLYENPACTASTLVARRQLLCAVGGFDESMGFAEDLELLVRIRCCTPSLVEGLPQVLTHYRANPSGASANLDAMQRGWEALMSKMRLYAPELVQAHYRGARAVHLRYLARRCSRLHLPVSLGLQLFASALASSPLALLKDPRRTFGTLAALLLTTKPLSARRAA